MLFDSPIYLVFLTAIVFVYWRLSFRQQNIMLLLASYFFYGWWDWRFLCLMMGSTALDYAVGRGLASTQNQRKRKLLLVASLVGNFTVLGFFKYFNFFVESFAVALSSLGFSNVPLPLLKIVLPPGISFYTFQEVAYIVDVYNRKIEAADSIVEYALFISLFPHLIAGPIQRPSHLLPQVQQRRSFDEHRFFDGILLIISGLFRKCVIADNCALLANAMFSGTWGQPNLVTVLVGTYAFAWQIYGDFSGYSDIARGSAQLLGFHFMVNFKQPYLAENLQQFWRRWHISLSTWLRDYLYIPLGGSAHGRLNTYRNLLLTMVLGGLWHGANWTFVVWGALHGGMLAVERWLREFLGLSEDARSGAFASVVKRVLLFHFVCLAWIFFRADSLHGALGILAGLKTFAWSPEYLTAIQLLALFSIPMFLVDVLIERRGEEYLGQSWSPTLRVAMAMCAVVILTFFSANQANAFIYFQF